ncbi:hypothetical protein JW905_02600 [bacterium]|nr:hypothetical protein [candidate division CSSED10-310 bacterium]
MKFVSMTLITLLVVLCCAGLTHAAILNVPAAYPTIQDAMTAAVSGDVVLVADGTYTGSGNRTLDFAGKSIRVASENGPTECVIDCQNSGRCVNFDNGEGSNSILEGFTIRHGYEMEGGAIYCYSSSPTILDCVIYDCYADMMGGAIYSRFGTPSLINCLIYNNRDWENGAIANLQGSMIIYNCTIAYNEAIMMMEGGGIYNGNGSLVMMDSIVWGNSPYQVSGGSTNITYCDIEDGWGGTGNINADPLFTSGQSGTFYLYQACDGPSPYSPCVDAGSYPAAVLCAISYLGQVCLSDLTTRTDLAPDAGQGDMGYHYRIESVPTRTPTMTPSPTPTPTATPTETPLHTPIVIHVPADYTTIQDAVSNACMYDTIIVADGTYTGSSNRNISFAGKAIRITSENGPTECVIDCQNNGRAFIFNNGEGSDSILEGFTIRNAYEMEGGALYCYSASPTILDCVIYNCYADMMGGALFSRFGTPTLSNCLIYDNWDWENGAIANLQGSMIIHNCTIYGNEAIMMMEGGGIYNGNGSLTITDSIVWGNSPYQISGGSTNATYCDIQGGWSGTGNIDADPLFTGGGSGAFYLYQDCDGTAPYSPCVDAGSDLASSITLPSYPVTTSLADYTTRSDDHHDEGTVDIGFHHVSSEPPASPTPAATMTPIPTDTPTTTPTSTPTLSPTFSPTATMTPPPTETPSPTVSPTATETPPPTATNTPEVTPTTTVSPTPAPIPATGGTGLLVLIATLSLGIAGSTLRSRKKR